MNMKLDDSINPNMENDDEFDDDYTIYNDEEFPIGEDDDYTDDYTDYEEDLDESDANEMHYDLKEDKNYNDRLDKSIYNWDNDVIKDKRKGNDDILSMRCWR